MQVDRARHRDALEHQVLILDTISRKPGEQRPDQCIKPMMKPSRTTRLLKHEVLAKKTVQAFNVRRCGENRGMKSTTCIMKDLS